MTTHSNSALRNADLAAGSVADSSGETPGDGPATLHSATEPGHAPSGPLRRLRPYWTPPAVWTDRPASLADLRHYADRAPWTSSSSGFVRGCGKAYWRVVGRSMTVAYRYREWIFQRPGRLLTALALLKLFSLTTPGQWLGQVLAWVGHWLAWLMF